MNAKKEKTLFEKVLDGEVIDERIKNIGAISTFFTEVSEGLLNESFEPSAIREVTYKAVTSKHFIGWFFKMEDFADSPGRISAVDDYAQRRNKRVWIFQQ